MKTCPSCGLRYPDEIPKCFVDGSALIDAPDPFIGKLIAGKYRIEDVLGEGGMATVYRARHTLADRTVAIKVFRKELSRDPKLRERFRREATSTARLAHPNIIEIMDSGDTDDGTPYLVMEFLQGESLEQLLAKGPIPLLRVLDITLQICTALARAHDFQVVHRDLKPDNLFVCKKPDGSDLVKILDFGIARSMHDPRLTGAGEVFGTPQYMAPERITSIEAGPSADLYAVGVILFELVTQTLPFEADDIPNFLLKHLREPPPRAISRAPNIPPALDELIDRLMQKDPAKRPVDAHAVVRELQSILAALPKPKTASAEERQMALASTVPKAAAMPPPPPPEAMRPRAQPTLAPATFEKWERRVGVFAKMLASAFPQGRERPDLSQMLDRVRVSLAKMADLRQRSLREQMKAEAIVARSRDAQARFGHAMDALGQDLSRTRQALQQARELEKQYADYARHFSAPFASIHQQIVAAPAKATAELQALYRSALETLDKAITAETEYGKAVAWLKAKERENSDTEFQLQELRSQLSRSSQSLEDERGELQKGIEKIAGDLSVVEQKLIMDASALANQLRGVPELRGMFNELEADAA